MVEVVVYPSYLLLLQEHMSELNQHFQSCGIETHMYASQWFLTIYTAKFPLSIVYRIFDIYLCEVCACACVTRNRCIKICVYVCVCNS